MLTRSILLYLSKNQGFKNFLSRFDSFHKVTRRFVAGEELPDGIDAVRELNRKGITASFDHLGESIKSEEETRGEVASYIRILDKIKEEGLNSNISVKLTQLGLEISQDLCYENVREIVEAARLHESFVRIDMEDSSKTSGTIEVFKRLRRDYNNTGIVIQSYLYRSEKDLQELFEMGARIRLCKGAYNEPASVAFPKKSDVDKNFIKLMQMLLASGIYHGIATHDSKIIAETRRFSSARGISRDDFEFQMLYGIRRDLQESLISEGYRVRVYVPYGRYWYPYFMRRLAERPANVWFVMRNMVKG